MAELAACLLHDRNVVGSNPAGSNSNRLVSITRIDGYIMSDKYDMEFPDTINFLKTAVKYLGTKIFIAQHLWFGPTVGGGGYAL